MNATWKSLPVFAVLFLISNVTSANSLIWSEEPAATIQSQNKTADLSRDRYLRADLSRLKNVMSAAALENDLAPASYIELPLPDGSMQTFVIEESPILSSELSAKYPEFKTYRVYSEGDRAIFGRLDLLPTGFHAYLMTDDGVVFIDPDGNAVDRYRSYYRTENIGANPRRFSCGVDATTQPLLAIDNVFDTQRRSDYLAAGQRQCFDVDRN